MKKPAKKEDEGITQAQILYWLTCAGLIVLGAILAAYAHEIPLPWPWLQPILKEVGSGILIAGILGAFVEPFFRREFARDAFLAAFRYVLPPEFREEVTKIVRTDFVAEKQLWLVKIEKVSDDVVLVTTSFERTIRNKTKTKRPVKTWYEAEDYKFPNGPMSMLDGGIEDDHKKLKFGPPAHRGHYVEAYTETIEVAPGKTARLWGKGSQYRRTDDCMHETFRVPIINPEIEVDIDESAFEHMVTFGTSDDYTKAEFKNHYTLSGVYFPGQFMRVRWWPKTATTSA